jgi:hypothetical protein
MSTLSFLTIFATKLSEDMNEVNENVATLAVVGTWNVSIFTPEWVKENVLIGKDFQILFPVNIMNSLKFVVPNKYSLAVNGNRLEFQLNDNCDVCSKELLEPVRNVLRSLIHTPVSSFGINYVFKTNEQPGLLSTLPHTNEIKDALNSEVESTEVTRSIKLQDGNILNFKIYQKGQETNFDFNFSYVVNKIQTMLDILGDDNIIISKRNVAKELLEKVYE